MPQVSRHICSNCRESVFNCIIDGQRVPLVLYFVAGQPADTGPTIDVNAAGVKTPSFIRELMHPTVPIARIELCMKCTAEVFGVPLRTIDDDPMWNAGARVTLPTDGTVDSVDASAILHERSLHAILVDRGTADAPAPGQTLQKQAEYEAYLPGADAKPPTLEGAPGPTLRELLEQARVRAMEAGNTAMVENLTKQLEDINIDTSKPLPPGQQ